MGLIERKQQEIVGGDVVWVRYRDKIGSVRYKNFRGVCISSRTKGKLFAGALGVKNISNKSEQTLIIRNMIGGVGVEYGFHSLSPMIYECKKISDKKKRGGRVKRYDLRKAT